MDRPAHTLAFKVDIWGGKYFRKYVMVSRVKNNGAFYNLYLGIFPATSITLIGDQIVNDLKDTCGRPNCPVMEYISPKKSLNFIIRYDDIISLFLHVMELE